MIADHGNFGDMQDNPELITHGSPCTVCLRHEARHIYVEGRLEQASGVEGGKRRV